MPEPTTSAQALSAPDTAAAPLGLASMTIGQRQRRVVRRLLATLLAAVFVIAAGVSGYWLSEQREMAARRVDATHRLDLFASVVDGLVGQLNHVPATIQLHAEVLQLIRAPGDAQRVRDTNAQLHRLNTYLGSVAIFVMDPRGIVLASSNADDPKTSFVGEDLSFRPYFIEALAGRSARHFAIGTTRGDPGYYVSSPIRDGQRVVGVAAVKVSLAPLADAWRQLGAPALLADANEVVILSSNPQWQYTALKAPTLERRVDWQMTRLYNSREITPFPLTVALQPVPGKRMDEAIVTEDTGVLSKLGARWLVQGRRLDGIGWRLLVFADVRDLRNQAALVGLLSAIAAGFVLVMGLYLQQRQRILRERLRAQRLLERANAELEQKVARRTRVLSDTNARLRKEVTEREHTEATLREAQEELVQAAKLAVLGQLATGITHELNQPLGAIRTLTGNAAEFLRRGNQAAALGNLEIMATLADQMGQIIQPLKGFARKAPSQPAATDVALILSQALMLFESRVREEQVQVHRQQVVQGLMAWCDPNRLAQVLVNLIGNALDALHGRPDPALWLTVEPVGDGRVRIVVEDNGIGLTPAVLEQLFKPFFTTKPPGVGLGLGLSISRDLVREFQGELSAQHRPQGGARFVVHLPGVRPDNESLS